MWGNALDHVLAVEVVTADGVVRQASESENGDLFWGLRGAGGSLGIVTRFTVKTHEAPRDKVQVSYELSVGSQSQMASVFNDWQALAGDAGLDRRFSTAFVAHPLGALVTGTFYGTQAEYNESGIPARLPGGGGGGGGGGGLGVRLGGSLGRVVSQGERVALELSAMPTFFYGKSLALREQDLLGRESVEALFGYMDRQRPPALWTVIFNSEGGAVADTPAEATAYPHRDKVIMYQSYVAGLVRLPAAARAWAQGVHERVQSGAPNASSTYAGYIDTALSRREAQERYWGAQLPRLRAIKRAWDPADVFRNPQGVEPADG